MDQSVTAFLFTKGTAESDVEGLVAGAQVASTLDTLERLQRVPEIRKTVVATANRALADQAAARGARVALDESGARPFHFGRRLAELISQHPSENVLYIGGGSGVLMQVEDWSALVHGITAKTEVVICNNYYSCDFAGWSPARALERIELPELDNDLAFRLGKQASLHVQVLSKSAESQLDLDTPTDLLTVSFHPHVGAHLHAWIEAAGLDPSGTSRIRSLMADPSANLLIAGRVSAATMLFLEHSTRCQWRVFSEERGMRASGRLERGQARSLLGLYLDAVGAKRFWQVMGELADGVIIDSRVLFAHRGLHPPAPDRFYSDLIMADQIRDPFIREWTSLAREANFPILLGGHSLVSGGPYALAAPLTQGPPSVV